MGFRNYGTLLALMGGAFFALFILDPSGITGFLVLDTSPANFSDAVAVEEVPVNPQGPVLGQMRGLADGQDLAFIGWDRTCVSWLNGTDIRCLQRSDNTGGLARFNGNFYLPLNEWDLTDSLTEVGEGVESYSLPFDFRAVAAGSGNLYLLGEEEVHVMNESLGREETVSLPDLEGEPSAFCTDGSHFYLPGYSEQVMNIVDVDGELVGVEKVDELGQPLGCTVTDEGVWVYGNQEKEVYLYE